MIDYRGVKDMRDIKFRAWIPQYKKMFQVGNLVIPKGLNEMGDQELCVSESYSITKPHHYIQPVLMQYTGLKDSTKWEQLTIAKQKKWIDSGRTQEEWEGVEIYEGDILKFCYYYDRGQWGENKSFTKVIKWDDLYCGFRPMCGTGEYEMPRRYYEVIGNIYEHGDLLEG